MTAKHSNQWLDESKTIGYAKSKTKTQTLTKKLATYLPSFNSKKLPVSFQKYRESLLLLQERIKSKEITLVKVAQPSVSNIPVKLRRWRTT